MVVPSAQTADGSGPDIVAGALGSKDAESDDDTDEEENVASASEKFDGNKQSSGVEL